MPNGPITIQIPTKYQSRRHGSRSQYDRKTYPKHHEWIPGAFQCARQHGYTAIEPEQLDELQGDKETNQSYYVSEYEIPVSGELEINVILRRTVILRQFSQQYVDEMIAIEIEEDSQYGEDDVGELNKIPKLFEVSVE